ncbi:MAG: hypothetical protein WCK29_00560 [archaeon]
MGIFLLTSLVSADVNQVNNAHYAILENNNSLTVISTINNFNVLGFVCSDANCNAVSGTLWNGNTLNSGSNTQISLTYPTTLQQSGYGIYYFKSGYIPYEVKSTWAGTGNAPARDVYLTKSRNCQIPINHLIITNNGNNITVNVTLDSSVTSPLNNAGPLNYIPSAIASYYSVDSTLDFRFIGPDNVSITKNVNLPFSTTKDVSASVTNLAAGNYRIEVESNTNDSKCLNSISNLLNSNIIIADNRTNATLPLIGIVSPQPIAYNYSNILINLTAINATNVWYGINGVNYTYTNPVYFNFSQGNNTLTAYAMNNVTTAHTSVTFNVNNSNNQTNNTNMSIPFIRINSPVNTFYANNSILLNITAVNATNVWYNYNGGINVSYTVPVNISFNNGSNMLHAFANNSAGINSTMVMFYVNASGMNNTNDTTAPGIITGLHVQNLGRNYIYWIWNNPSDSDFAHNIIFIDGVNVLNSTNNFYNLTGLGAGTTHTIGVETVDFSGNRNTSRVNNTATTNSNGNNGGGSSSGGNRHNSTLLGPYIPSGSNLTIGSTDDNITMNNNSQTEADYSWLLAMLMILILILLLLIIYALTRKK